jgi:hypothetical protein
MAAKVGAPYLSSVGFCWSFFAKKMGAQQRKPASE